MPKRKTHEEYVAEVARINPNLEVVGIYINSQTPILHRCKIHGYEWYIRPAKVLIGQGCPKCAGNAKKTTEEYKNELSIKNPTVEIVGEYYAANIKTTHHCLIHDVYWEAVPYSVLGGVGCAECLKDRIGLANRKTQEQYVNEVKQINPNIIVLGQYKGMDIPLLHRCLLHNVEWTPYPASILRGCGCAQCASEKLHDKLCKTHEQYVNELANINPNIIVIETYIDAVTPRLHRCSIDGYEWYARPANILFGNGCPKCSRHITRTHEEYVAEVALINSNIEVVGTYINATTHILHRCKIDGNEWYARPDDILHGRGCPQCKESKGERQVRQWLDMHCIAYETQYKFVDCRDNKPLPFDFYLFDHNCCVEYDGKQHFEPVDYFGGQQGFDYTQKHDAIKNQYCIENNIKLLRIPYYANVEEELNNFLFI